MGWWFGRILTFEIEADDEAPTLGALLNDATGGVIDCGVPTAIGGYAAHGRSMRAAVEPLVDNFGVELVDDGSALRSPSGDPPVEVSENDLGCGSAHETMPRSERAQRSARALPASLTVSYYDPARDYQTGQMRASVASGGVHDSVELPACLAADFAKALAHSSLARRWAERDTLTLRLPPPLMRLTPGTMVRAPDGLGTWVADRVAIESMAVVARLKPSWTRVAALPAEPGRPLPPEDVIAEPTVLALIDLPDLGVVRHDVPVLHLAACTTAGTWRPIPIEISVEGEIRAGQTAYGEAVVGSAATVLGPGQSALFDLANTLEVELADGDHWLESRDDDALVQGANLAAVGGELIQFGAALPLGGGRFRLSKLLRGRRGTEWAIASHTSGDAFVMIGPGSLRAIELAPEAVGAEVDVRALGLGDGDGILISAVASGEALRPPSPVHLRASWSDGGSLELKWVRRSRSGWAWLDEVDAPLGESSERYRVRIEGTAGATEFETSISAAIVDTAELAIVGAGAATIEVRQIGDQALSRAASLSLHLS